MPAPLRQGQRNDRMHLGTCSLSVSPLFYGVRLDVMKIRDRSVCEKDLAFLAFAIISVSFS